MKILYLHQWFNTPAMPGSTRSYEMAKRWASQGHEIHIITSRRVTDDSKQGWTEEDIDGVHVHWLSVPYNNHMGFYQRILAFFRFAIQAGPQAVQIGGDLVFATSTPLTIALPGVFAKWRLKIPMVFEVRDLWPEIPIAIGALKSPLTKWVAKKLERWAYHHSSQIIALSPGMAEGVEKAGYPKEKIHTIPNSCDIDLFGNLNGEVKAFRRRFPWLEDRPLIIYAGTLGEINGVSYFPRLAAEMIKLDSRICFLVVGDGKEKDLIAKTAMEKDVMEKNFFMLPAFPKSEMPALFGAASVSCSFVIPVPELWHNSANKFFDSLAAGTPIIINHEGWQADLLRETGAGIVLDPFDPGESAKVLLKFINNPEKQKRAINAARLLATTRFNRDHLARQALEVFSEATNGMAQ